MDALPDSLLEMLARGDSPLWCASLTPNQWPSIHFNLELHARDYVAFHLRATAVVVIGDGPAPPIFPPDTCIQLRSVETAPAAVQALIGTGRVERIEASESWQVHLARGHGVTPADCTSPSAAG